MLRDLLWFIRSDLRLRTTTVFDLDNVERIDGFYFHSKKPFSRSYQWHATIGLEYTYPILKGVETAIKNRELGLPLHISGGMGYEKVIIWRGSLKKTKKLMYEMIKKIQEQY